MNQSKGHAGNHVDTQQRERSVLWVSLRLKFSVFFLVVDNPCHNVHFVMMCTLSILRDVLVLIGHLHEDRTFQKLLFIKAVGEWLHVDFEHVY